MRNYQEQNPHSALRTLKDFRETEVKLRYESVNVLKAAGLELELEIERHFEDNWLLDDTDGHLRQRGAILRVRSLSSEAGGKGLVTYKEEAAGENSATQFKKRVEIETKLDEPENALVLFERLGYRKWFRYQKYRTVYHANLPDGKNLQVMFDETPIGNFIELEGEEEAIAQTVNLLGIIPADYILESYLALQVKHCQEQGKPLEDMVFVKSEEVRGRRG